MTTIFGMAEAPTPFARLRRVPRLFVLYVVAVLRGSGERFAELYVAWTSAVVGAYLCNPALDTFDSAEHYDALVAFMEWLPGGDRWVSRETEAGAFILLIGIAHLFVAALGGYGLRRALAITECALWGLLAAIFYNSGTHALIVPITALFALASVWVAARIDTPTSETIASARNGNGGADA